MIATFVIGLIILLGILTLRIFYIYQPRWISTVLDISFLWVIVWTFLKWLRMYSGHYFDPDTNQKMLSFDMMVSGFFLGMIVTALFLAGGIKNSKPRFKKSKTEQDAAANP